MGAASPALIDELLPQFDEFERHERLVAAAPPAVYAALKRVDLRSSRIIRWLILLRGAPAAPSRHPRRTHRTKKLTRWLTLRRRPPAAVSRHPRRTRRPKRLTLEAMLQRAFVLLGERPERELA